MPCPHRVRQGNAGTIDIKVTRASNVNQIAMVVEDLDRSTQQLSSTPKLRTTDLEAGVSRPVVAGHSYNLFLTAVRKSADSEGSVQVTISNNGATLVNSTCSVNGTNPSGSWTIIV